MPVSSRITLPVILILLITQLTLPLSGQDEVLKGRVTDTSGVAIPDVSIFLPASGRGAVTGSDGYFTLGIPSGAPQFTLIITSLGYINDTLTIDRHNIDEALNITLVEETINIGSVAVRATKPDNITTVMIPVSAAAVVPSLAGGIETAIATLPGVSSFSELTYRYSVRGGSYDENLVYVNDIEIYRPYLIRAGQQEGLSQINPDLAASVSFSSGGFSAAYGDRMSSVLDIRYRVPETNEGSVSLSLLTSSAHIGLRSSDNKLYLLAGARYRSNTLLLGTLDSKGQYTPHFTDIQTIAGYIPNENTSLTLSIWGSSNRYSFIPESQTTTFGTIDNAFKLYAYFEGGERDRYESGGGAITLDLRHGTTLTSRFILTGYLADERENFDIRGAYSLSSLDKTEGSENNPDSLLNAGVGSWLAHARNSLQSGLVNLSYKGTASAGRQYIEWGINVKQRHYRSSVNEWLRVDSAGYTIGNSEEQLTLTSSVNNTGETHSFVSEAYFIITTGFSIAGFNSELNAGLRTAYDTYTSELLISPRLSLKVTLSNHLAAYISSGAYHQPPAGREMMAKADPRATEIKAQRSLHITTGTRLDFTAWERPFRFTAEIYGKFYNRVVPYTVNNVRTVYYGGNIAEGYSAGLDMRVNGEFVPGVESWFSFSLMKSEMKVPSYNSGWFPSPFDQRVSVNIFFQDYLPGHPDFRAHVNIAFGTGLPSSPPGKDQWDTWFRMPPYRRIDLGFSKVILGMKSKKTGSAIRELVAGLEIFNLADISNTISYTWIQTVRNSEGEARQYAVPNYLTGRSLNLSLTAQF